MKCNFRLKEIKIKRLRSQLASSTENISPNNPIYAYIYVDRQSFVIMIVFGCKRETE